MINALAVYLFLPVPFVLALAVLGRRWILLVGAVLAVVLWASLWGQLFLPGRGGGDVDGPSLTLMSFNVLVFNRDSEAVITEIRRSDADVVFLLELSVYQAEAIKSALAVDYPYMTLEAGNATGSGVLSRLPYQVVHTRELADEDWIGEPAVISLQLDGRDVTLVRFHAVGLVRNLAIRERQAHKLVEFVRSRDEPVIVAGDLNATPMNESYALLKAALHDSWREAGSGLGQTFPGASKETTPGTSRPSLYGVAVPRWLVRIDYVFHTSQWRAVSIRNSADAGSDHRAVIAKLVLKP